AVFGIVTVIVKMMAGPSDLPLDEFARRTVLTALIYPGLPLVAHTVYFGPLVPLCILCWRDAAAAIGAFGTGLLAFVALGLLSSLNTESRVITQYVPAFVLAITIALSRRSLTGGFYAATTVLAVLFSKVWLSLAGPGRIYDGQHYQFPEQR